MLYNAYISQIHKQTTSMDTSHIYMTYTYEQTSDMNANNAYLTHMHKQSTSMDARHICMTFTFEQTSDINAIQCTFNTHAQANNKYGYMPYIYDIHTQANK